MPSTPTINVCAAAEGRRGLVLGFAVHGDRIYAVGGQGADLFLTSDDGVSFKQGSSPGPGLRSVMARDDGVWVVGEYGYIARSNDRGTSWKRLPTKSRACLFGVAADDAGTIWFSGESDTLWKSKDGTKLTRVTEIKEAIGRLVTSPLGVLVPTDTPGHLFFIRKGKIERAPFEAGLEIMQAAVTPRGTIVTAGLKGTVWRSEDEGKTFERIASNVSVMLTGVDSFADGRVVIAGEEGVLLLSNDDGKSFERLDQFVSAGTLWCVKRYAEAVLVGGEDGLVMRLGDLAAKKAVREVVAASPAPSPTLRSEAARPAWAAPAASTAAQAWTPPPPMPLEIVRRVYVTPELRAMLYPRRGGIAVPLRPLPTMEEAWGSLRRALWAADRAHMNRKNERSGIWNLVTSNDVLARRLGDRIRDVAPSVGTFADDVALVKLTLERYRTFVDQFHETIWDATADFLVASVGLAEAVNRTFTGLDDELPYTGVGPFGRLRDLMVLADDKTHADAKRAVLEALPREVALAKDKRDNDRVADLHWAATFLLPLGPEARSRADTPKGHEEAGEEERRRHDAALTFTGEFGNVNIHACGLASGDLATLELFRKKNRKTRHEFFSPTGRMYLASILEMEGAAAAHEIAGMKPADPFDDDPHYNGRWCRLLAHIADEEAFDALHKERATKGGRIWGTAGLLLAARSDPARLLAFAKKKNDAELVELVTKGGALASEPEAPEDAELGVLATPFAYEPLRARHAVPLVTALAVAPEMTWRDEEREALKNQGVYEEAVTWDGVPLRKCTPEAVEAYVAHHEKWAIPTDLEDLVLAPASARPRLLALGFRFTGYQAAHTLGKVMLTGGLDHLPVLVSALADGASNEAALAAAQPFGDVSCAPAVVMAFAGKKLKALARSWMLRHPVHAAAGAVAMIAANESREAVDAASRALRYLDGRGKRDIILEHGRASGIESRVREILETDPLQASRLRSDVKAKVKLPVLPVFAKADALPSLVTSTKGNGAPADEVSRLLLELAFSNADEIHPGVIAAKTKYTAESRAAFAWALFEAWLAMAADPKHGWCMQTVGFFGDDTSARKLAALAKVWPGQGASVRAQAALDALLNIGTDVALVNINLLAEKSRFPAFKAAAKERIGAIADARGLSTDELQDRLVPSLGLDEDGGNVLDYGKRKFTIEFDEQLSAVLRDESGARLGDAPKPTKTDDAALAKAAKTRLSGLRKDARASASLQIARLERAMCTSRMIERDVFIECFATHPWMRFLARRLVWAEASPSKTFRVADDGSLADVRDATFELTKEARARVIHPLDMGAQEREAWSKVFGDYEIIQPFPQLARTVYEATDSERAGKRIERFRGKKTTVGALRGLESRGWERWIDDMVMGIGRAVRVGGGGGVGAGVGGGDGREVWVVINVEPGWHPSDAFETIPPQTIDTIVMHGPQGTTFGELSPIAFSEILYDAARLF